MVSFFSSCQEPYLLTLELTPLCPTPPQSCHSSRHFASPKPCLYFSWCAHWGHAQECLSFVRSESNTSATLQEFSLYSIIHCASLHFLDYSGQICLLERTNGGEHSQKRRIWGPFLTIIQPFFCLRAYSHNLSPGLPSLWYHISSIPYKCK